jgi:hypothetical protein
VAQSARRFSTGLKGFRRGDTPGGRWLVGAVGERFGIFLMFRAKIRRVVRSL